MILSSTSELLRLRLDATVATSQLAWVTSFNDITTTTFVAGDADGNSNNATDVTIVGSPAATTQRQVTTINVYNNDTLSRVVTVEKFDGTNARVLVRARLAPGDTLYWSREAGWTVSKGDSGQSSYIVREYIANDTWTKPGGIKAAILCAIGAGGGGGSGMRGPATTNRFGGGGGAGGGAVWYYVDGDSLTSTLTVTVGTGGSGGPAITVNNTVGGSGAAGGDTSIGSIVIARGGGGGGGGTAAAGGTAGAAAGVLANTPAGSPYSLGGGAAGAGATSGASNVAAGMSANAAPGGTGGRGITNTNANGTGTLTSGGVLVNGAVQGASTTPGASGINDLARSLFFNDTINGDYGIGAGGTGGDVAGNGGNGGRCAGGAGGGASLDGTNSGAGGAGGGGLAKILEIY
jgi:hypothetical protein